MLACAAMLVGWLAVYVPVGFRPTPVTAEDVAPVAGPPGTPPVRVSHASLTGDAGIRIDITVFDGLPPYPGGPMVVAETRTVSVGGAEVSVVWTSMFMGTAQEVAVVYPRDPAGVGSAMVVIRGMPFAAALKLVPTVLRGCA